jgi:hypothetical protein
LVSLRLTRVAALPDFSISIESYFKKSQINTGLSICKDAGIVTLEGVVQDVMPKTLEDLFLPGKMWIARVDRVEAMVKGEGFGLFSAAKEETNDVR